MFLANKAAGGEGSVQRPTRCPRYDSSARGHNWAATWTRFDSDFTEAADLTSWAVRRMSKMERSSITRSMERSSLSSGRT